MVIVLQRHCHSAVPRAILRGLSTKSHPQVTQRKKGLLGQMPAGHSFGDLCISTALASVETIEKSVLVMITKGDVDASRCYDTVSPSQLL